MEPDSTQQPEPYGAVEPAPVLSGRGRRSTEGGVLVLQPSLDTVGYGLLACLVLGLGVAVRTRSLVPPAIVTGGALLVWAARVVYVLRSRVRLVEDVLEIRLPWRHETVPLHLLDAPVRGTGSWKGLRLRMRDGRHLATLGSLTWGEPSIALLAERLGAVTFSGRHVALEREYPGSLGSMARHQVPLAIAAVGALIVLIAVASLLKGSGI